MDPLRLDRVGWLLVGGVEEDDGVDAGLLLASREGWLLDDGVVVLAVVVAAVAVVADRGG